MLNKLPAARSLFSLSRLNEFAKNTELVTRNSRKFSPQNFLLTILKSVCSGQSSFNQLAISLVKNGALALSKQAVFKRLTSRAVAFLLQVINDLLASHCEDTLDEFKNAGFSRILVEDSSFLRLPKSNAENFPAHGNANGPTAGVKCSLCCDLLSQKTISFGLHSATDQD